MAKAKRHETEFDKLSVQMERGFSSVADDIGELRAELTDFRKEVSGQFDQVDARFEQVDAQFEEIKKDIRDIRAELVDIHRRLDRLEEQGASSAGFAKEIDIILSRVVFIEKHLGIKRVASK